MSTPAEEAVPLCLAELKNFDPVRYYACLFTPERHRAGLAALYAFDLEIARVRAVVSDPMPGEIRLQWWHDALGESGDPEAAGHPVLRALLAAVETFRLPRAPFRTLIEARRFDLYDDPMERISDLETYCGETASALFRLASLVLAEGGDPGTADAAGHAGVAYGIADALRAFPLHAARGQIYLPTALLARHGVSAEAIRAGTDSPGLRDAIGTLCETGLTHLASAESLIKSVPMPARRAFLPLVAVRPLLQAIRDTTDNPYRRVLEPSRLGTLWRMWRQTLKGKVA